MYSFPNTSMNIPIPLMDTITELNREYLFMSKSF
jgi:hypothetical protein